jgi:V/A-type H+-transporting ATPase subunit D
MADVTPSRSALLDLVDERRAMHEGHGFLDEMCVLLAGEMLVELARLRAQVEDVRTLHDAALAALAAAVARHGLEALQVYPLAAGPAARVEVLPRRLMGVRLQAVSLQLGPDEPAAGSAFDASPEAAACRLAFRRLAVASALLAASQGNLERLDREYHRASRRSRALADVLIPEADRRITELDTRLGELEQEDAVWRRPRRREERSA